MALTQSEFFDAVNKLITNSRASDDIMDALDKQGVTDDDLQEGEALLAVAQEKAGLQDAATEALRLHTPIYQAAEKKAQADYQDLVGACRAQLSPAQIKALQIKEMPSTAAKLVNVTNTLIDAIGRNTEIKTALAKRKRDAARLTQIRASVKAYGDADTKLKLLKGALKQATTDQNNSFKPLSAWFKKISGFARLGLKGKKDLLDQILPKPKKTAKPKTNAGGNTTPASP